MEGCENVPAFVICLESKAKARCDVNMESIRKVFPLAERTAAVDANDIGAATDPRISCFAKYNIQRGLDTDLMHINSAGAVGCALSHIGLWNRCASLGQPIVVVEDDMFICDTKAAQIRNAMAHLPTDVDFASIMYSPVLSNTGLCGAQWCPIKHGFAGMLMYYVTPRGARILLQEALPVVTHVDAYIGFVSATHPSFRAVRWAERIYTLTDMLQDHSKSTLGHTVQIRKLLPHGNAFYVMGVLIVIALIAWASVVTDRLRRRR